MKPKLTKQEKKVYDYIRDHAGCTTHDITVNTYIQKPCARITQMKQKGVEIENVGEIRYGDSRPFKKYALKNQLTKQVSTFEYDPVSHMMVEHKKIVNV